MDVGTHDAGGQSRSKARCQPRLVLRRAGSQIWPPHLHALLQPPAKFPPCPCLLRVLPSKPFPPLSGFPACALILTLCTIVSTRALQRHLQSTRTLSRKRTTIRILILDVAHTRKPRRLRSNLAKVKRRICCRHRLRRNNSPPSTEERQERQFGRGLTTPYCRVTSEDHSSCL